MNSSYVIGTGWWCDGTGKQMGSGRNSSSDEIRKEGFFYLWNRYINKFTDPYRIVVVDSASPVRPKVHEQKYAERYVWRLLANNPGHGKGWWKGVIESAKWAHRKKKDYIYVEQDCLVYGVGWVERCLSHARESTGILLGRGDGTPQPIQQSLMVVTADKLEDFISGISNYKGDDGVPNEVMFQKNLDFDWLPIHGGRARPIKWNLPFWYAQHFTDEELKKVKNTADEWE